MRRIFERENPEVLFHAAAYKHVPMMELHPWEVVFNNILAAQSILEQCCRMEVERFCSCIHRQGGASYECYGGLKTRL